MLPAYAAVQVARAALADSMQREVPLQDALAARDFATVIGPVRFDDKGDLTDNPYRLFRFDGTRFVPVVLP